jgi:hypothetical protein
MAAANLACAFMSTVLCRIVVLSKSVPPVGLSSSTLLAVFGIRQAQQVSRSGALRRVLTHRSRCDRTG